MHYFLKFRKKAVAIPVYTGNALEWTKVTQAVQRFSSHQLTAPIESTQTHTHIRPSTRGRHTNITHHLISAADMWTYPPPPPSNFPPYWQEKNVVDEIHNRRHHRHRVIRRTAVKTTTSSCCNSTQSMVAILYVRTCGVGITLHSPCIH